MDLDSFIQSKLNNIKKAGRYRDILAFAPAESSKKTYLNSEIIDFASNDYLGLSKDPIVLEAGYKAAQTYGSGSGASRLISGTSELDLELEKQLAFFQNTEAAIFFESGYSANIGTISALVGSNDAIFSDELNHSSLISGAKLSGAKVINYKHCSIEQLRELLQEERHKYRNALITTDSVFSMDGDIAPLKALKRLAEEFDCWLMTDEAHAIGIFGNRGQGLTPELFDLKIEHNIIQVGTCSKALGLQGGFVAGSRNLINFLQQRAKTFIYSTASSPFIVGALLESLKIVQSESWRRERLLKNAEQIKNICRQRNLKLFSADSQIICFGTSNNNHALEIQKQFLQEYKILVGAIRQPTSPTPRIRLTVSSSHSEENINLICEALFKLTDT